jgi:hypothetical protein
LLTPQKTLMLKATRTQALRWTNNFFNTVIQSKEDWDCRKDLTTCSVIYEVAVLYAKWWVLGVYV